MSPLLAVLVARIRFRRALTSAAYVAASGLLAAFVAIRVFNSDAGQAIRYALMISALFVAMILVFGWRRRVTALRVAAHLDARYPTLENSAGLLVKKSLSPTSIEGLQRKRVEAALAELSDQRNLTAPFDRKAPRAWAWSLLLVAVVANALGWRPRGIESARVSEDTTPVIEAIQIEVRPPAYTGRSEYLAAVLSPSVEEGAQIRFTLLLDGLADTATLSFAAQEYPFYDGEGNLQQTVWLNATEGLYQVLIDGQPLPISGQAATQEVLITKDTPPEIQIILPETRLQVLDTTASLSGVGELGFRVDVTDDIGVGSIGLEITRSAGSGEQVSFEKQFIEWRGEDAPASTRVALQRDVDLAGAGLTRESELYLNVVALDKRPDGGRQTRSPTYIVRWQDTASPRAVVIDNPVVDVMPEYFRSQRQIIIDTESLIAEREQIDTTQFNQRAQRLAGDQRALRLQYGRFLGEEVGGEPAAGDMPGDGHYEGDGHDHDLPGGSLSAEDAFSDAATAIAGYAHVHDEQEAATLFDPETRDLLRAALSAMWASEGRLRQFDPELSLPYQNKALVLLKRVQNRSRATARRVGVAITPPDPGRRFSGELDDIALTAVLDSDDAGRQDRAGTLRAFSELLARTPSRATIATETVMRWLQRESGTSNEADSAALAALVEWQTDASCDSCRQILTGYYHEIQASSMPLPLRERSRPDLFGGRDD